MDNDVVVNIKSAVEAQLAADSKTVDRILNDRKIVVAIVKGPTVLVKMVKLALTRKRPTRTTVSSQMTENIKTQRQFLKGNMDALYVFTLIEKTKENIKTLNIKDMRPEAVAVFDTEIRDLITRLSATQKLLCHKPN